jgi:hypothetical protein
MTGIGRPAPSRLRKTSRVPSRGDIPSIVATAFLAGAWEPEFMAARAAAALGEHRPSWLLALAVSTREWFTVAPRHARDELASFIAGELRPRRIAMAPRTIEATRVRRWQPLDGEPRWPGVLALDTVDHLSARLELDDGQLAWLADVRGLAWPRRACATTATAGSRAAARCRA